MDFLRSGDIILYPLTIDDKEEVYALFSNQKVLKSYLNKPIKKESETIDFIERITAKDNFTWTIRLQENKNVIIGVCSLHHWNKKEKTMEIGGTLFPDYWGKKIMLQAFNTIINYAFVELDVKSIIGKTLNINSQAIALILKLGFEKLEHAENEVVFIKKNNNFNTHQ